MPGVGNPRYWFFVGLRAGSARELRERMMRATLQLAIPFVDKPRVETLSLLQKFGDRDEPQRGSTTKPRVAMRTLG